MRIEPILDMSFLEMVSDVTQPIIITDDEEEKESLIIGADLFEDIGINFDMFG